MPLPKWCSNNGACDGDGICECNYAWTGEDCSVKRPSIVKPGVIIPIAIGTAFLGAAVVIGIQLFGGGARCLERKGPEHERLKEENMPINKQKMVEPIVGDIEDNGTKEIQNPMSLQSEGEEKDVTVPSYIVETGILRDFFFGCFINIIYKCYVNSLVYRIILKSKPTKNRVIIE